MKNLITNAIKSKITWSRYKEYVIMQQMQENALTEDTAAFTDLSQALDNALKKLPEKTSRIFQLSRFENQSVKDIARELNLSEKAVEYHITESIASIPGGGKFSSFSLSGGYYNEKGIIGQNFQFANTHNTSPDTQSSQTGLLWSTVRFHPGLRVKNPDGSYSSIQGNQDNTGNSFLDYVTGEFEMFHYKNEAVSE